MSAATRTVRRAPTFSTTEFVDIDIDPEELERAGWVYVGKKGEDAALPTQIVLDVVRGWHDRTHPDPWRWCSEEPCDTLRGRDEDS